MSNIYSSTVWAMLKSKIENDLYHVPLVYWNVQLAKVIQTVAAAQGIVISELAAGCSAIRFNGSNWQCLPSIWADTPQPPTHHFVFESDEPDLIEKISQATSELTHIKIERYETDRFLCGLFMYYPSLEKLKEIFGEQLSASISKTRVRIPSEPDIFQPYPLEVFLEMNAPILVRMQERCLVNLLMSDITK